MALSDDIHLYRDRTPGSFTATLRTPLGGVGKSEGAARDALVDDLVQRKGYMLSMPAWQTEPRVNAHIADIYAYLSARAQGTKGPDRLAQ